MDLGARNVHSKQADTFLWLREHPSKRLLCSCTVRAKSPASHTQGTSEGVRQRYLEAICQRTGYAHIEASAAMAHLHLHDPHLPDARAPELLNAIEPVDVQHIAVMPAARYSRRPQRPRPLSKSQLASASETSSAAHLATMLVSFPMGISFPKSSLFS